MNWKKAYFTIIKTHRMEKSQDGNGKKNKSSTNLYINK